MMAACRTHHRNVTRYPRRGSNNPPNSAGNNGVSQTGGAESGAVAVNSAGPTDAEKSSLVAPVDPDLARLVVAWPTLPEAIRRGILAIVESAVPSRRQDSPNKSGL